MALNAVWGAMPGAAKSDVEVTFQQLMALHRKKQALIKEIRDAERAMAKTRQKPTGQCFPM